MGNLSFLLEGKFLQNLSLAHWNTAVRILRYLRTTCNLRLVLGGSFFNLAGYANLDWAKDIEDQRSTSGYSFQVGSSTISWKSKKQPTVLLSSTEAEYKAPSNACKEGLWLWNMLCKLKLCDSLAVPLYVDNRGAKALAKNPQHHSRTKHIDTRHHFIARGGVGEYILINPFYFFL